MAYVASGYRRDKIWLRRTRAATRDYQVVLAVDNSQSMSEACARALAADTLAMLWQCMQRLEVGRLAVVAFGARTRLLHALDASLATGAGAECLRALTFDERSTYLSQVWRVCEHFKWFCICV
jgi:midasin